MTLFPFLHSAPCIEIQMYPRARAEIKRRGKIELYRDASTLFASQRGCEGEKRNDCARDTSLVARRSRDVRREGRVVPPRSDSVYYDVVKKNSPRPIIFTIRCASATIARRIASPLSILRARSLDIPSPPRPLMNPYDRSLDTRRLISVDLIDAKRIRAAPYDRTRVF